MFIGSSNFSCNFIHIRGTFVLHLTSSSSGFDVDLASVLSVLLYQYSVLNKEFPISSKRNKNL